MPLGAPSLWPEMLMACDAEPLDVEVEPAGGLDGVGVERHALVGRASRESVSICWIVPTSLLAYWMLTSVVSSRSGSGERGGLHHAVVVDVEDRDLEAEAAEVLGGLEHRRVLDRRRR